MFLGVFKIMRDTLFAFFSWTFSPYFLTKSNFFCYFEHRWKTLFARRWTWVVHTKSSLGKYGYLPNLTNTCTMFFSKVDPKTKLN